MPRGVKGSGPQKDKAKDIEVEEVVEPMSREDQIAAMRAQPGYHGNLPDEEPEVDEERIREEFNEHIKALVKNFVEQEISGLDERIRDLEQVTQRILGRVGVPADTSAVVPPAEFSPEPETSSWARDTDDGVPEYTQEHTQGSEGTPWYRG